MTQVRTRIAPSPTGDPHVGTAYIALFNRCFAHQHGGDFVLRIEDTDQLRSTERSEHDILASLRWLGLDWDEGPGCEGDYGPYRQSERSEIYAAHIQTLLDQGDAFHCFCTAERLNELRKEQTENKQQTGYDGHCLGLSKEEVQARLAEGVESVIRMKVPREGQCEFTDLLRGEVAIAWSQIDMQVLMKSDGLPTYHFANVVDDHLMKISHVIRGEEWINSVPKHVLLYKYFNWEAPVFCHMPLLRNPDKSKLSKRKNPTSINYYRDMGYLPEALLNYLAMMGWTMPNGEEMFSLEEMQSAFDISRVSLGGPVFDTEKLDWLNGKYLREVGSDSEFVSRLLAWASESQRLEPIVPLLRQRVEKLSDVAPLAAYFFAGNLPVKPEDFSTKQLDDLELRKILQFALWELESLEQWQRSRVELALMSLAKRMGLKVRDFLAPLFVAVTGQAVSLSVIDSIAVLGLDITRARIRGAIDALGGISKKQAKAFDKLYEQMPPLSDE